MREGFQIKEDVLGKMLTEVVWDYTLSKEVLLDIFLRGKKENELTKETLEARLLGYFGWHQIVRVLGIERAVALLSNSVIERVFPKSYQQQLYGLRRILSTETLSSSR